MYKQRYFLNSTLFNHHLIILKRFEISPLPKELEANNDITVKIKDENGVYTYNGCHIDNTANRRLRLPFDIMLWIKNKFPFSVAYFSNNKNAISIWKKKDIDDFDKRIKNKEKLDIPSEYLLLSWETENEGQPYLCIQAGFRITEQNAGEVLSAKAMATVLPYIFSSVKNTSYSVPKTNSKKCYIIDKTTDWMSASKYKSTAFSHPGIYILRRKEHNQYFYYVGKAADIENRIITYNKAIVHPDEKDEQNKQYDDICCVSINLDDIRRAFGILNENTKTPDNNPGVPRGSTVDNILYAIEDVAIHTISMILKSEGKKLDNVQYRTYTSEWLYRNDLNF